MKYKWLGCSVLAGFLATGGLIAGDDAGAPSAAQAAPTKALMSTNQPVAGGPYIVLGYLEKRGNVITIKSSSHGTVYSVANKDGKVILENVTAEQLRAQAPEIYSVFKTGVAAGNDARGSGWSGDARISPMRAGWGGDARY